jgi:hypothetical protein
MLVPPGAWVRVVRLILTYRVDGGQHPTTARR